MKHCYITFFSIISIRNGSLNTLNTSDWFCFNFLDFKLGKVIFRFTLTRGAREGWIRICCFHSKFLPNILLHSRQGNFELSCEPRWYFKLSFRVKTCSYQSHLNVDPSSALWVFKCLWRLVLYPKDFWHTSQVYNFSPECVFICRFKLEVFKKSFRQVTQTKTSLQM